VIKQTLNDFKLDQNFYIGFLLLFHRSGSWKKKQGESRAAIEYLSFISLSNYQQSYDFKKLITQGTMPEKHKLLKRNLK
jgi:hypothetical protein